MNNLMECKTMISSGQAKMSSLSDELLEHEKELQAATNRVEELVRILKHNLTNTMVSFFCNFNVHILGKSSQGVSK